ncbi:MAG: sugar ABC transporter permease [Phycisphaerales bacterium]|nr:sugar ABC transporter permease [Phycisphaerales bacterium]
MSRFSAAARDQAAGLLWVSPWIIGFLAFMAVPAAMSVYYSFTDYALLEPPVWIGLDNYRAIASDKLFFLSLRNTLVYALGTVTLGTVLSLALALLLDLPLRWRGLVRAIVFLPTLVPIVAVSLGWMWIYNPNTGLINVTLRAVGVEHPPNWLGLPGLAMGSLIFMSLWMVGSAVVIYGAALRDVPVSLREAAAIDGAGPVSRFRNVTLPMISPAVLFNVIMSVIWSLQVFAIPYIMTKGGPNDSTLVYSMYVFRSAFEYGKMGYASALAWLQLLVTLGLTLGLLALARRFVYYRAA